VTDCIC